MLKLAFLAYYPVTHLKAHLALRNDEVMHPASWIVNLTRALSRIDSVELHLVIDSSNVLYDQDFMLDNVHYHWVRSPSTLNLSTLYFFNIRRLIRKLCSISPDLVHAHGCEGSIGLAGVNSGFPCLLTPQGLLTEIVNTDRMWLGKASLRTQMLARLERRALRKAKYVGTKSEFATSYVKAINPRVTVFYTPDMINNVFFAAAPRHEGAQITYVGSVIPRKGLATLIEAWAVVRREFPDSTLSIVGTGPKPYRNELEESVSRWGLSTSVRFLGHRTPEQIVAEFEKSAAFVFPSLIENSPNAVAEAMCAGLPVIATKVGGIPAMVEDGVTGLLVPPRNARALADAIIRLLANPAFRTRLGHCAREKARRLYSSPIVTAQMLKVYKEIVEIENTLKQKH